MTGLKYPRVFIGYDPRESDAFRVACSTASAGMRVGPSIEGLKLSDLRERGLYKRPTERRGKQLWDVISDAAMSTEFAVSRFLCPIIHPKGWSLFMDCDVMIRGRLDELFDLAKDEFAVMCVKHNHQPTETTKMDGQEQTRYSRKNWSSVMLFNGQHPSNKKLTLEMVNTLPGRDLHRFCWLEDHEIGELGPEWNYLVGHTSSTVDPKIVHFTDGVPSMEGYENVEYADEWRANLDNLTPGVRWLSTPFKDGVPAWAVEDQAGQTA